MAALATNEALLAAPCSPGWDRPHARWLSCVPSPHLAQVSGLVKGSGSRLGAQDVSAQESGAYTGEVSAAMLRDFEVRYTLVGHSERRQYHGETDATVGATKHRKPLAAGITHCLRGETLAEREAGRTEDVVKRQLAAVIHANGHCISEIVLAYEPVWAIGTGKTKSGAGAGSARGAASAVARATTPGRPHQDFVRRQHECGQCRNFCWVNQISTVAWWAAPSLKANRFSFNHCRGPVRRWHNLFWSEDDECFVDDYFDRTDADCHGHDWPHLGAARQRCRYGGGVWKWCIGQLFAHPVAPTSCRARQPSWQPFFSLHLGSGLFRQSAPVHFGQRFENAAVVAPAAGRHLPLQCCLSSAQIPVK